MCNRARLVPFRPHPTMNKLFGGVDLVKYRVAICAQEQRPLQDVCACKDAPQAQLAGEAAVSFHLLIVTRDDRFEVSKATV